jgi:RNA-directed DNA polymerase
MSARLRDWIEAKLEGWLGLQINRDKTRVLDLRQPKQSLDFLGYTFGLARDRYGRSQRYWNLVPSRKALAREREALRGLINHHQSQNRGQTITMA